MFGDACQVRFNHCLIHSSRVCKREFFNLWWNFPQKFSRSDKVYFYSASFHILLNVHDSVHHDVVTQVSLHSVITLQVPSSNSVDSKLFKKEEELK